MPMSVLLSVRHRSRARDVVAGAAAGRPLDAALDHHRGRKVRSTILTNLAWAFGYNLIALALAVAGVLQPVLAAAIMASSSLLLVVNSLRLSRLPDPIPGAILEPPPSGEPDSVLVSAFL